MNDFNHEIVKYVDENARDEFSAAHFFKNEQTKSNNCISGQALVKKSKNVLCDITNNNSNARNKLSLRSTLTNGINVLNVTDKSNKINSDNHILNNKSALKRTRCDFSDNYDKNNNNNDTVFLSNTKDESINYQIEIKRCKSFDLSNNNTERIEPVFKIFDRESNALFIGSISHALTTPANGLNGHYQNVISVPTESPKSIIIRIREGSVAWKVMRESALIDDRVMLTSSRIFCSPQEQFVVTKNNQYQSKCLINVHCTRRNITNSFDNSFETNYVTLRKDSHSNSLMTSSINTSHFHDLHLENLPCFKPYDFMRASKQLTGSILGGFVNDIFELSKYVYLPSEVIHFAVDLIYGYLSRVHDVPLVDMKWITLGAIYLAAKTEGLNIIMNIKDFADCKMTDIIQAELRIVNVIDFNFTKPHSINFRNRFLLIEPVNSTILHLSSFILEMSLHSYTLLLEPASKRAAAAMWLARLIDKFADVRFNDDIFREQESAIETMDSVWPVHFVQLSGYFHHDISKLALKMHVIIIAFISSDDKYPSRGGGSNSTDLQVHPSVSACHEKYSSLKYGELTTSYEKFTARTVYYASELYCRLNNCQLSSWMDRNEYEILLHAFTENKPNRSFSVSAEMANRKSSNSCPEFIGLSSGNNYRLQLSKEATDKRYKLLTADSGYSTQSID